MLCVILQAEGNIHANEGPKLLETKHSLYAGQAKIKSFGTEH